LGSGGLIKSGNGVMTLSRASYNSGGTTVNNGTLRLGAGLAANPLLVIPTATVPTVADLNVNGGTIDLNGNTQAVRSAAALMLTSIVLTLRVLSLSMIVSWAWAATSTATKQMTCRSSPS